MPSPWQSVFEQSEGRKSGGGCGLRVCVMCMCLSKTSLGALIAPRRPVPPFSLQRPQTHSIIAAFDCISD